MSLKTILSPTCTRIPEAGAPLRWSITVPVIRPGTTAVGRSRSSSSSSIGATGLAVLDAVGLDVVVGVKVGLDVVVGVKVGLTVAVSVGRGGSGEVGVA
jgi:hypothetical protein